MSSVSLDQQIDAWVAPASKFFADIIFYKITIGGASWPLVVLWLMAGAVLFTLYLGVINLRGLFTARRILKGEFNAPNAPGEVTHFQALTTAISGTVGIGNIGGVAVAVSVGGAGATFWMIIAGFLGMATKFAECTLGVAYRRENPDGTVSGGPMFYLNQGLAERGLPRLGKMMGALYAIGIVIGCLGIGNMFQSNQAFAQALVVTGGASSILSGYGWVFGLVLAGVVGLVIVGGIQSIARVTEKIVPFMAGLYLLGAVAIILLNAEHLLAAINAIITGAFSADGVAGGVAGTMVVGFQRAVFSNEAGIGSASIAHSAVRTDTPVTEGYVSLFEPLIDTIVICTLTALVIGTTSQADPGFMTSGVEGVAMTSEAFRRQLAWSPYLLAIAALLFAVSTMISWSYYGLKGWTYLFGEDPARQGIFKFIFCLFVALGASVKLDAVLTFSDAMVFVLCVPNILGLVILAPQIRAAMKTFEARL